MEIRPAEISEILKKQIAAFDTEANVAETGQVLSVGDGIARVFGLQNCMAGEMVEFPTAGLRGMALNLETDNVGIVIFGDDRDPRGRHRIPYRFDRRSSRRTRPAGRVVDGLGNPIDGKGPGHVRRTSPRRGEGAWHYPAQICARTDADRPEGDKNTQTDNLHIYWNNCGQFSCKCDSKYWIFHRWG